MRRDIIFYYHYFFSFWPHCLLAEVPDRHLVTHRQLALFHTSARTQIKYDSYTPPTSCTYILALVCIYTMHTLCIVLASKSSYSSMHTVCIAQNTYSCINSQYQSSMHIYIYIMNTTSYSSSTITRVRAQCQDSQIFRFCSSGAFWQYYFQYELLRKICKREFPGKKPSLEVFSTPECILESTRVLEYEQYAYSQYIILYFMHTLLAIVQQQNADGKIRLVNLFQIRSPPTYFA